jgi:L-lactate dehydrogenase (cytochrome)
MQPANADDARNAARRRLPRFLFDYVDGGAGAETTLGANMEDLARLRLRQRVLRDVSDVDLSTTLFGETMKMPVILAPIGLAGMLARRGEVQAARAARSRGVPYTLSTVSLCPISEVAPAARGSIWFQLYVLRDRGFMADALERAKAEGVRVLVFTVDMPVPGARRRDARSGMSGPNGPARRLLQAMGKPRWAFDVGLLGRPHTLGGVSAYLGRSTGLTDYIGWLGENFDPSISWRDLEWIRTAWTGPIILKGVLDPDDAREARRFGADGIVVSNHGGRQLEGAPSTASALPAIADAVGADMTVIADSGVRSGVDVVRMMALGARAVMIGRAAAYALAAGGEAGVGALLDGFARDMKASLALSGLRRVEDITPEILT